MARQLSATPAPQGFRAGYDAAEKWSPFPDWTHAVLENDGWSVRPVPMLSQTLVSGDFAAACRAHAPEASEVGLWGIASTDPCYARVARDRILLVSSEPLDLPMGWNSGWAASPAGDAWFVVDVEGPRLRDVIAEGTGVDLESASPSAAVLFAGVPIILYRIAENRARMHIETGFGPYLWRWLDGRRP